MTLYHFCPEHLLAGIKKKGLALGQFPLLGDGHTTFIDGYQWLTAEPDPNKQSWATREILPYSRTAYRLTVNVPPSRHRKLKKATEFIKTLSPADRGIVEDWPGSDMWYIYRGIVPAKWITKIENMEANGTAEKA
jgi:hypothetical protein